MINPEQDRRHEVRFVSRENVVIKMEPSGKTLPAVAFDIGEKGLKLAVNKPLEPGLRLQVAFPNSPDHVHCFGNVIWSRPDAAEFRHQVGVQIETWMGIVEGKNSWKKFKGFKPQHDRRNKKR